MGTVNLQHVVALATFVAAALLGCEPLPGTGSSSGASSDGGDSGISANNQACLDTADAYAKAGARCGGNYDTIRHAFIRDYANGDCDTVSIRKESELRAQCLPSLARIPCADLANDRVDPSCAEQIIRSQ